MAKAKKELSDRQRAGLVEKDFEQQPRDEVVEAGEHLDVDETEFVLGQPSALNLPYMSEEDQGMALRTEVVGPPAYGSPDPATSAGKLLSLRDHPLNAAALPEGHPAAIAEDYGKDHLGAVVMPGETSSPVIAQTDLELDLQGRKNAREGNYEEMTKAELKDEAEKRGLEVSSGALKADYVDALEADDGEADDSNPDE